jgi:signal transduction histidine kinase
MAASTSGTAGRAFLRKTVGGSSNASGAGRTAPSHGAGLGLAIVAEIMKAHGGNVEVNAGPHGGAVFTLVFLPALAHAPP